MGPPGFSQSDEYTRLVGPANFGTSSGTATPSTTGGDTIGIFAAEALLVPENYVSNNLLSSTSLYPATTFAELGVTLGRYEWTWGTGSNQSFTLIIGETPGPGLPGPTPVPEPSSAALLGIALAVLWLAGAHSFGICASLFEKGVGS